MMIAVIQRMFEASVTIEGPVGNWLRQIQFKPKLK